MIIVDETGKIGFCEESLPIRTIKRYNTYKDDLYVEYSLKSNYFETFEQYVKDQIKYLTPEKIDKYYVLGNSDVIDITILRRELFKELTE